MNEYAKTETGPMSGWNNGSFSVPDHGIELPGKHFIGGELGLTGMEISVNGLKPGEGMSFLHRHRQNEEVYLFLEGAGEMQIDDDIFPVGPGTAVRVSPAGRRGWRNTGNTDLTFLVIQSRAGSLDGAGIADGEVDERAPAWA